MERILIIAALPKELEPVLKVLESPLRSPEVKTIDGRRYYEYKHSSELSIICTTFIGMGQLNSATAVTHAINNYNINKVILTGICGGVDREMNYGDIIISDQIVDYELGKVMSDGEVSVRWQVYRSDFELIQSMSQFKSERWKTYLKKEFPDKYVSEPNVCSGIVLSGNKVISSSEEVTRFKMVWRKALAVEMEGSGIAAVLWQMKNPPSFIMVKSICDFADSYKNDDWQEYASYASASFVLDFILNSELSLSKGSKRNDNISSKTQKLFVAIKGTYDLSELNVLAFNIGVDIEDIKGTGKSEKIVELIKYCQRRQLLDRLVNQVNEERDNLLIDI